MNNSSLVQRQSWGQVHEPDWRRDCTVEKLGVSQIRFVENALTVLVQGLGMPVEEYLKALL
jgi:hypothetical protein